MADEILNTLGFDVTQALSALQNLDSQLQASQVAFQNHATQLGAWNAQARITLDLLRQLGTTAAGITLPSVPTTPTPTPTPTATAGSSLWLPPGVQDQINAATQSMSNLGTTSAAAGQQMATAGAQGAAGANSANTATKRLTISWQMLTRIILTQAIVRALSAIRNMLQDVTKSSIEFQKSLAEIQAITPKIHGDFASLGDEAANLSKKFNIPLPQVTEGLYQTISNQFVTVADRTRIMEAAMKLARTGCMDLDDAVLLLTGTLNAYGMGAENAEIVSAKFFKTIQLGRVRGKELADTLGTVLPYAAQLGVSLDEVAASYVSMTIGGLEAHKTATGLRQAMVALLKPSEDLKKVLREMGFTTPEQLLQAKDFQGALEAISEASNNMGSEIIKSIRNVRAITAQLSLTRNQGLAVKDALEKIGSVGADSMKELYEEFTKMPAERLTKQINELSVTLTQDFGMAMTQLLADMVEFFGGAEKISAALQALVKVLAYAGAAVLGFAATWAVLHISMGPIGWALLGIGAAMTTLIGVSTYQSIRAVQDIKSVAQAARDAATERVRVEEEALRKIAEAEDKKIHESIKAWENKAAKIRSEFFREIDRLREKNTRLIEDTRVTLTAMVGAQERVVSAYRSAAKAAANAVIESRERQVAAEAAYSDVVFNYAHKNEGAYRRAESYMQRARFLAKEAQEAMEKAKTPEQISAAQAAFKRAEAAADEAEQIAGGTKSIMLQEDAQRTVLGVMRSKIEAEESLQRLQAEEAARLAKKAADEQGRLNRMKVLMKAILEDLESFTKEGAKEPKALAEQEGRLRKNIKEMREKWLTGPKVEISDMMAFDKLQQRVNMAIEGGVTEARIQDFWATPETYEKLNREISEGIGPVKTLIQAAIRYDPELKKMMEGLTLQEQLGLLSEKMKEGAEIQAQFRDVNNQASIANKTMLEVVGLAKARYKDFRQALSDEGNNWRALAKVMTMTPEEVREVGDAYEAFKKEAEQFLRPDVTLDEEAYLRLNAAYEEYVKQLAPTPELEARLIAFLTEAKQVASAAGAVRDITDLLGKTQLEARAITAKQRMSDIQSALQEAEKSAKSAKESTDRMETSAGEAYTKVSAVSTVDMTNLTTQTRSAADAMWDLARASMSVKTPTAPELAARGGRVGRYLAAGGPVGTDVVPAWLSRGEFVMSAGAAGKFASQLVAMNAGVQPNFRSDGGGVTNIGDINVTVQGGATGRQSARSIARELRRELRRGTTTL